MDLSDIEIPAFRAPTREQLDEMRRESRRCALADPASAFWWYPKVKDLDIPQPRTILVEAGFDSLETFADHNTKDDIPESAYMAAREIGYPLFMRTDLSSAKHDWKNSCLVERESDLAKHMAAVAYFNFCMGLRPRGWMFRELLPLEHDFEVFEFMPCSTEWRVFVNGGNVECFHPYWEAETILEWYGGDTRTRKSFRPFAVPPDGWEEMLAGRYGEVPNEVLAAAGTVGRTLGGAWSVDMAKHVDGTWYLTDMAPAGMSYHKPGCPNIVDGLSNT